MAQIKTGLKDSLNAIREMSVKNNSVYHQYVPVIEDDTDIGTFGQPILTVPVVMNEFISALVNRIVYTRFEIKYFKNKLQVLEGEEIPLGYAGQEIYVNPAVGRNFNTDDFAGLLQKYEADVKVQYTAVNTDLQYPVTVSRHKLKQAFVSWDNLDSFIAQLSNSLYNGAYIDEYNNSKGLVSSAYKSNQVRVDVVQDITSNETVAKEFITKARTYFLNFQEPSNNYNAWEKVGGAGKPVMTFTIPEDIVFIIRNDILAYLDVNVLAMAFNVDKSVLLGNIIGVNNFDIVNRETNKKVFDGSNIFGIMADKSWFRIRRQDMYLDEFYNANNRTWQYYLNLTKMYNYSLFSNAIVFASKESDVVITGLSYNTDSISVETGDVEGLDIVTTPVTANTPEISYEITDTSIATVTIDPNDNKHVIVTGLTEGSTTLTATTANVSTTLTINVTAKS